jgi:hypothetical protein
MSVSSKDYVFGSYTVTDLNRSTGALLEADEVGLKFHTLGLRTWLETTVVQDHHKFAEWLYYQPKKVVDVWLKLANSGTSSPWLSHEMNRIERCYFGGYYG